MKIHMLILLLAAMVSVNGGEYFKGEIFPLKFMDNEPYTVVENLPAVLSPNTWAVTAEAKKELGQTKPVMLLKLPEFLRLRYASIRIDAYGQAQELPFTVKENQYEIPFFYSDGWYNQLAVGRPHSANDFRLYLEAVPGAAGKTGEISWSFRFGNRQVPEASHPVRVLPALDKPEKAAKSYALAIPSAAGSDMSSDDITRRMTGFYRSLSSNFFAFRGNFNASAPVRDYMVGCNKQFIIVAHPEMTAANREWRQWLQDGTVPPMIDLEGRTVDFSVPAWYLLDDPEQRYEKYLTAGAQAIRRLYPDCRRIYFNYEPGADGVDPQGLARFAEKQKLAQVPTREEVAKGRYKDAWFNYMVDLNDRMIRKVSTIFKREMPGVEFWLCTDNLHAKGGTVAYWCAVDSLMADKYVDGHMPMPYYCGSAFFDDMAFSMQKLSKPVLPLADPSERVERFFKRYTPEGIRQNIVAGAALGLTGYGFWPDDLLPGAYFQAMHSAYGMVARAEAFYQRGKRLPADSLPVKIANSSEAEVVNEAGQKISITYPDYSDALRYTVHELDGKKLLTAFNYDAWNPLYLEVAGQLLKIAPLDVLQYQAGDPAADQPKLAAELDALRQKQGGSGALNGIEKDQCSIRWYLPAWAKKPVLLMINPGQERLIIDALQKSEIIYWHDAVAQRYLGQIMLYDQSRVRGPYPFVLDEMKVENSSPEVGFRYIFQSQDAGADFPYQGLELRKTFRQEPGNTFVIGCRVSNRGKSSVTLGLRIANMPFAVIDEITSGGVRLTREETGNHIFAKNDRKMDFLPEVKRNQWDGSMVTVKSPTRSLTLDGSDFDGVYVWCGDKMMTVEFLTGDFTLAPGEERVFQIRCRGGK